MLLHDRNLYAECTGLTLVSLQVQEFTLRAPGPDHSQINYFVGKFSGVSSAARHVSSFLQTRGGSFRPGLAASHNKLTACTCNTDG